MIDYIPETRSTNADLASRLRAGERVPEGYWLVADRQTAGKGRQGREWLDGAGNFMGSTVVHLGIGDPLAPTLALVAGLAAHRAVSTYLPSIYRATLKWPNDVMIDLEKLGGILLEREGDAVIIGIGVNVATAPQAPDRLTIALSAFGSEPDRNTFADVLARQFDDELGRWRSYGLESLVNRWLAAAYPLGTSLFVDGVHGRFAGLTPEGALQLRLADGSVRTIHAGEVNLAD